MSALVEVAGLSFSYPGREAAVKGVSFSVAAGEHLGIVGPNGAGKSTLLRLLGNLLKPSAGEVRYDGKALPAWSRLALAKRLAYVPQSAVFDAPFTALDVAMAGRFPHVGYFGFESARDRAIARSALERLDARHLADRPVTELSGGEQARVVVARALAQEPDVLLLDEPTAFLDVGHRLDLYDRLREENRARGLTVLVVTHDLNMAAEYCSRVLLLSAGTLAADGPASEVLTAERVSEVYRCRVVVDANPATGAPRITPLPRHAG
jgi:iron complex transport system ATP-binding protein